MNLCMYAVSLSERIGLFCQNKSWVARTPVLLFLGYLLYEHLIDQAYFGPLGTFNLVIHEAGHMFFMPFGETLYILGGTILQLAVPILCLIAFFRQNELLGVAFSLGWIGDNLFNIAAYIADARVRALPLITGDPDSHDWHALLGLWNMLPYDTAIGGGVRLAAILLSAFGILLTFILLSETHRLKISATKIE